MQASGRLLRLGGVTAALYVTQAACGGLAPVAILQPHIPVWAGSSGPGRRVGQGIPSVLTSDLRLWFRIAICTNVGFSGVCLCLHQMVFCG